MRTRQNVVVQISIHVLREEDDGDGGHGRRAGDPISIHVLREEDDLEPGSQATVTVEFLSTSSARRTTS